MVRSAALDLGSVSVEWSTISDDGSGPHACPRGSRAQLAPAKITNGRKSVGHAEIARRPGIAAPHEPSTRGHGLLRDGGTRRARQGGGEGKDDNGSDEGDSGTAKHSA